MGKAAVVSLVVAGILFRGSLGFAAGTTLPIPPVIQQKTNWCWAAVGTRILHWYGYDYTQCSVHLGAQLNCFDTQDTLGGVNQALFLLAGISGRYVSSPLTWSTFTTSIDRRQPVAVRWRWTAGGGHILLANGYAADQGEPDSRYIDYIDSSDGTQNEATWSWFTGGAGTASDHTWTHSLYDFS